MGRNVDNVDMKTSKTTMELTRTSAWTDNSGETNTITPPLRKVLTGLIIGQIAMVIITAAIIGVFVNSNMKEIDVLRQTTESMQARISILEASSSKSSLRQGNETKWKDVESKIKDVLTNHDTDFIALSNNLTGLQEETAAHKLTLLDHDTRLTQLQSVIEETAAHKSTLLDHDTRLSQLQSVIDNCTSTHDYDTRILRIEADTIGIISSIQSLEETTTHLADSTSLEKEKIEALNTTIQQLALAISANEDNITVEQMKVAQLELERTLDQAAILDLNTSIADINLERTLTRANIETLNLSITEHEIIGKKQNDSISELLVYIGIQTEEMNAQNMSLVQISQDVETNKNSLRNISDVISVLNAESQAVNVATEANSEMLLHLGLGVNTTKDLLQDLELRVSSNEGDSMVYAQIHSGGTVTIKEGDKAIFKTPDANIGNAYSIDTGIFEAPFNGTYFFSVTLCASTPGVWAYFSIVHDQVKLVQGVVGDPEWSDCNSISAAAYMRRGSQVWAEYSNHINNTGTLTIECHYAFTAILVDNRH